MHKKVILAVFVALILLVVSGMSATGMQVTNPLPTLWAHLNNQNSGLYDDAIGLIEFDSNGSTWFVGWEGLSVLRPTGDWEYFTPENSILVEAPGWSLTSSQNGDVWVGTRYHGAFRLNQAGVFTNYTISNSILESNWIHAVKALPNGDVLIGTIFPGDLYLLKTDNTWEKKNVNQNILDIQYDSNGTIWLGTLSGYLVRIEDNGLLSFFDPPCTRDINNIAFAPNGWIWLATHDGICGVDPSMTQWKRFVPQGVFAALAVDNDGVVWSGDVNGLGLFSYDPTNDTLMNYTSISTNGELTSNKVYTPILDSCGRIWIGTIGGGVHIISKGYSISGHVFYEDSMPAENILVSDQYGNASTTNQKGFYCINSLPTGTYTLTPVYGTKTFLPPQRVVITDQQLVSGQDFIIKANTPPTILKFDDILINEGANAFLSADVIDIDGDMLTYQWDLDNDGEYDDAVGITTETTFYDNGIYTVGLKVTDESGEFNTDTAEVTVLNVAPTIGEIAAPTDPIQVGLVFDVSTPFNDPGADTWTAIWDWGDGTSTVGTIADFVTSGSHIFETPGVYTVSLTVTDDDGGVGAASYQYVVAYDPEGGFVTGGGWIWSPLGAYVSNETLEGKATFGFVSKYQKGANVPTGNTEFQFHVAGMRFKSTAYDWLVIAGTKAMYKGTGTINGTGEYGFMLSAIDGAPDKFRIKIWNKATDELIYDNQIGAAEDADPTTELGGGSIVIHKK